MCVYTALKRARFGGARHGGWESERVRSGLRRVGVAEDCYLPCSTLYTMQHTATHCNTLQLAAAPCVEVAQDRCLPCGIFFAHLVVSLDFGCAHHVGEAKHVAWSMSRVIVTWLIHKMHNYTSSFYNQSHDCDPRGGGGEYKKGGRGVLMVSLVGLRVSLNEQSN